MYILEKIHSFSKQIFLNQIETNRRKINEKHINQTTKYANPFFMDSYLLARKHTTIEGKAKLNWKLVENVARNVYWSCVLCIFVNVHIPFKFLFLMSLCFLFEFNVVESSTFEFYNFARLYRSDMFAYFRNFVLNSFYGSRGLCTKLYLQLRR